jgi:hypothetical protein
MVVAAALADIVSSPRLAFFSLVLAVPFAAAAALSAYGDLVEADEARRERRIERLQAISAGVALALLVIGTAARSPMVGEGVVPRLSTTALILCLGAMLVQWVVAGAAQVRQPVRIPNLEPDV